MNFKSGSQRQKNNTIIDSQDNSALKFSFWQMPSQKCKPTVSVERPNV